MEYGPREEQPTQQPREGAGQGVSTFIERFEKLIKPAPKKPRTDVPPERRDQLAQHDQHARQGNPAQETVPEEQIIQISLSNKDKQTCNNKINSINKLGLRRATLGVASFVLNIGFKHCLCFWNRFPFGLSSI